MAEVLVAVLMAAALACDHRAHGQELVSFSYAKGNFSSDDFKATGDASFTDGELWLTGDRFSSYGRMIRSQRLNLCNSSGAASFTSDFVFNISRKNETFVNADGLAFLIAPGVSGTSSEGYGRWLGLFEPTTNGLSSNRIIAVEFDTYQNAPPYYPEFQDIDSNHVGIDINGIISINSSSVAPLQISHGPVAARINYNAVAQELQVYVTSDVEFRDLGHPVLEHSINLCAYVNDQSYVGFSAGAGGGNVDFHRILSWSFSAHLENVNRTVINRQPQQEQQQQQRQRQERKFETYFIVAASLLGALVLVLAAVLLKLASIVHRNRGTTGRKDLVLLPREIPLGDILLATENFGEHNLLGKGGFGSVYRGLLPGDSSPVAIKRMAPDSHQGEREFLSEIQTIGKLSHRNLVKLRGWCNHRDAELVIVYEYMPQGSLDDALFKSDEILPWSTRNKILCGLASVLVYLHEEWEQQIVHRDIKCSNVMLDDEFNARLGDFGLARTARHEVGGRTTITLAGTVGYMAPEVGVTYKFTPASDVYSFGVVALEVASGRQVLENGVLLLPWVEEKFAAGEVLSAVDGKLRGDFDAEQVTRILQIALQCIDSDPSKRPTMRQVFHVLSGVSS